MQPEVLTLATLPAGTVLVHYKGGRYQVVGWCRIEATLETGVLYQPLQGNEQVTWMRPLSQFQDHVQAEHGLVPRFRLATRDL